MPFLLNPYVHSTSVTSIADPVDEGTVSTGSETVTITPDTSGLAVVILGMRGSNFLNSEGLTPSRQVITTTGSTNDGIRNGIWVGQVTASTSYSWVVNASAHHALVYVVYDPSEVDLADPIVDIDASQGTPYTAPAVDGIAGGRAIWLCATRESSAIASIPWTAPSGYTLRQEAQYSPGAAINTSCAIADKPLTTSDAVAAATGTATSLDGDTITHHIVLRPAS